MKARIFLVTVLTFIFLSGMGVGEEFTCNSCSDCRTKIVNTSSGDVVLLESDIVDQQGICMIFANNGVIFDCQGHLIDGSGEEWTYGIYMSDKQGNEIRNCVIREFGFGIHLYNSSNITLVGNNVSANVYGIYLHSSLENILTDNTAGLNGYGIYLQDSSSNILRENEMVGNNYSLAVKGSKLLDFVQDIDTSNEVESRPIYYWINYENEEVPEGGGFVGIVNSTNITVKNLEISGNYYGVLLAYSRDSVIENINFSANRYGIHLWNSDNNRLTENNVSANSYGIWLWNSSNNTVAESNISSNQGYGVYLQKSHNNTLSANDIIANTYTGIYLWYSLENTLMENTLMENTDGFYLYSSSQNTLTGNNASSNENGIYLYDSSENSIEGNYVEWNDHYGIYLQYSSENTILENFANSNSLTGIQLTSSSDNTLTNNTANSNYWYGIQLSSSSGNVLTGNVANFNDRYGIYLYSSSGNTLVENNLVDNEKYSLFVLVECNNSIDLTNLGGQDGKPILYEHDTSGITIANTSAYSEIFLCNVSNSLIDNVTVSNADLGSDGIFLFNSNNNTIRNSNFSNNRYGIYLYSSLDNVLNSNRLCFNSKSDLGLHDSDENSGSGNSCDNAAGWNDSGTNGCSYLCVSCVGDSNHDGNVDYTDLLILAISYNTEIGDSNYDSRADFDSDGDVDYNDLLTLSVEYGSVCISPTPSRNIEQASLSTGSVSLNALLTLPQGIVMEGFIFESQSVVNDTYPDLPEADVINVASYLRTITDGGIIDMGLGSLDEILECPGSGYVEDLSYPRVNVMACVRTLDGKYAKLRITEYDDDEPAYEYMKFTFDWVHQDDGGRNFTPETTTSSTTSTSTSTSIILTTSTVSTTSTTILTTTTIPPAANVSVEPSSYTLEEEEDSFEINITATPLTNIQGYSFELSYDPEKINATGVTPGDYITLDGSTNVFNIIDLEYGLVSVDCVRLGSPIDMSGTLLATIEFEVLATGTSQLILQNVMISNQTTEYIPLTTTDGEVTIGGAIPGDTNNDGVVNFIDLLAVAVAYNTEEGDEAYNPAADFNDDGKVNFHDLLVVATNYD